MPLSELPQNYKQAISLIDEAHALDPNSFPPANDEKIEHEDGSETEVVPYELHYARKMTRWLAVHSPGASPEVQIACRAQHFRRWELPRSDFPPTRTGYLSWRARQQTLSSNHLIALLSSPTITPPLPESSIAHIASLVRKDRKLVAAGDVDAQIVEDVACLVFLDDQIDGFVTRTDVDEEKSISILRKTWVKMGARGRELALGIEMGERAAELVGKALA